MSTKTAIKSQAKRLFKEQGYIGASMRELADAVGIEGASLYYHFKSKEVLLSDICFELSDQFFSSLHAVSSVGGQTADVTLSNAMRNHIKIVVDNIDASAVFVNEWRMMSEPAKSEFKRARRKYEVFFKDVIENGIQEGTFRKDINADLAAITILSALNGIYTWYNPDGDLSVEDISTHLENTLLNGIKH